MRKSPGRTRGGEMRRTERTPIDDNAAYEDLDKHNGMSYFVAVP